MSDVLDAAAVVPLSVDPSSVPTITERTTAGRLTNSNANQALVPAPAPLGNVPLPHALVGKQAKDVQRLVAAGFRETARHIYTSPGGEHLMAVVRYEKGDEKQFRPLRCIGADNAGVAIYDLRAVDAPRPLYNLQQLAARPEDPVLVVEGEKAADAAAQRFPDHVATTWPNGAKSVGKVDVRDLAGRTVVLWPDNDPDGKAAMAVLARRLLQVGCRVSLVEVPATYPRAWDCADADPADLAPEQQPAMLLAAAVRIEGERAARLLRTVPAPYRSVPLGSAPSAPSAATREVYRLFQAARFLASTGKRNFWQGGGYGDWFDLMCAAKNGHGDAALAEFAKLSAEYGGTATDEQLRRKWDSIEQRPEGQQLTPATFFREAIDAGWEDPTRDDAEGKSGSSGGRKDPASVVLEQSEEAGDVLWLDQYGRAHVSLAQEADDGTPRTVHARVGSSRHKGIVSQRYRQEHKNKVLSAEQERRAILLLEHQARESGKTNESAIRVAEHADCIYIDLGNTAGSAVRVSASGWEVVQDCPVRFVRGNRGELPTPLPGGKVEDFQRHLNLEPRDVVRVLAFVLGALAPLPSYAILLVEGRQGTGKSTLADMVVALCDPPLTAKGARISMPKGERNLLVHASGVRVVYVDNVSDISESDADAFCRLATGGGTSARQHYTDEDEVQLNATRPAIVTAIGSPTARGDFLDRCLRVTALPIDSRRTERAVWEVFLADRPKMFGFVLDALACALRNKASVAAMAEAGELRLARMADFGEYVEAAAEVLGLPVGSFSADWLDEAANLQAESAAGDPLGEAIVRYLSAAPERKELVGFATEFLGELRNVLHDPTHLPAGNKLKGSLRRIEPGLNDLGLAVEIIEPSKGVRNRKTRYRVSVTERFDRTTPGEKHF